MYVTGDERVNEQTALTTMHTIWMREHNRIEGALHMINTHWDGEYTKYTDQVGTLLYICLLIN